MGFEYRLSKGQRKLLVRGGVVRLAIPAVWGRPFSVGLFREMLGPEDGLWLRGGRSGLVVVTPPVQSANRIVTRGTQGLFGRILEDWEVKSGELPMVPVSVWIGVFSAGSVSEREWPTDGELRWVGRTYAGGREFGNDCLFCIAGGG